MIDYREKDIEETVLTDEYLDLMTQVTKLRFNKPTHDKDKNPIRYFYYRDYKTKWFNEVWAILHYLAKKTREEGHCPQKDIIKQEIHKLLGS